MRRFGAALALAGAISLGVVGAAAAHQPTCTDVGLGIDVHGMHVIRDYVIGEDGSLTTWPPKGGVIGQQVAGEGVEIAGGPGPGFHFAQENPIAPGASFCTDSNSPGVHVN